MAAQETQQQIEELRASLEALNMPESQIEKMIAQAEKQVHSQSQDDYTAAMSKAANHEKLGEHRLSMAGNTLTLKIVFTEEGEAQVTSKLRSTRSGGGGGGRRGKKVYVVDGTEYPSAAEACRQLGIDVGSDSATRKLKAYVKAENLTFEVQEASDDESK